MNHAFPRRLAILACICLLLPACGLFGRGGSVADGQKALSEGKYRSAYIEATKVLRGNDKNGEAWLLLAKSSLMLGNPRDALGELQHAEANGVPRAQTVVTKGEALMVAGEFDKTVTEVIPDQGYPAATNARIDAIRGDALRALKRPDDARLAYEAALKLDPGNARSLAGLARMSASTGDVAGAEKYVRQSLAAIPDNPRALVTRGDLAFERRDFASAAADYQNAADSKAHDWTPQEAFYARARLADSQTRQNKLDDALKNIVTLEKQAPDQPYPHYLHAEVLYKQGHMDSAVSQLQLVLKNNPDDVPSQMLMGAISFSQGDYGQAEMYFSNVIGVSPENLAAHRLLALSYFRAGNLRLATSTLRSTVTGSPSDETLLAMLRQASGSGAQAQRGGDAMNRELALAGAALGSGNDAEAVRLLELAKVTGASQEAQRDTLLVVSYLQEHRVDDALKVAAARVARSPNDASAHLLYGTALMAGGKVDEARSQYAQALKLDPGNVGGLLSMGSLDAIEGRTKDAADRFNAVLAKDPHSAPAMAALGKLALAQGDRNKATDWFKRAVGAAPADPGPRLQLIMLYGSTGEFEEAAVAARVWASAAPQSAPAQNALGVTELNAGHPEAAMKALQQAVQLAPGAVVYRINLARAQAANKDDKGAKATLGAVIKNDPSQVQAVAMLAFMELKEGDLAAALAQAKALQQQPATQAQGYSLEGDLYAATRAWDKAAPAYEKGLKLDFSRGLVVKNFLAQLHNGNSSPQAGLESWIAGHPEDVGTRLMLAQYYLGKAQAAPAVAQYEQILKAHPTDITALNNLAWIYVETNNPKAVAVAAEAYKLAPSSPNVLDTYGWALVNNNKLETALPLLAKAAKAAPEAPTIQYHLAVAQAKTGDKGGALATLQALRKVPGDFPERQSAEKLYKELGGVASSSKAR